MWYAFRLDYGFLFLSIDFLLKRCDNCLLLLPLVNYERYSLKSLRSFLLVVLFSEAAELHGQL